MDQVCSACQRGDPCVGDLAIRVRNLETSLALLQANVANAQPIQEFATSTRFGGGGGGGQSSRSWPSIPGLVPHHAHDFDTEGGRS